MSGLLNSATAGVLESALARFAHPVAWPDPASGFAFRLLGAAGLPMPPALSAPLRSTTAQRLRRAPELAAFGYVIERAPAATQSAWIQAFGRLMGRDAFPSDRNSFVYNPIELVGIAVGLVECPAATDEHRAWLASIIQRGFAGRQFAGAVTEAAAICAEGAVVNRASSTATKNLSPLVGLHPGEIAFLAALGIMFPGENLVDVDTIEKDLFSRVLTGPISIADGAEAAALYVTLRRGIERLVLTLVSPADAVANVVALCRRFQLFIDRLQARQRDRRAFDVSDEYDVQDLLHAILKLHFDDVRPEEWTPSYAGNSSRTDFLLPRERIIVEAKMTRAGLGQRDVTDQLIIDAARYAKAEGVDHLICLIYDPGRRCTNPTALEHDLAQTTGRLRVAAIVCPQGT